MVSRLPKYDRAKNYLTSNLDHSRWYSSRELTDMINSSGVLYNGLSFSEGPKMYSKFMIKSRRGYKNYYCINPKEESA